MSGYFITFEGIDGCGKTTQLRLTAAWLRQQGLDVLETFEPGDTALGSQLRALLLSGEYVPAAETELLLFLADRTQHVREVIEPALKRGTIVLCDRYTDSTRAYQLGGRALDADRLEEMEEMLQIAELGISPVISLWFDLPVEEARERMRRRVVGGEAATRLDEERQSFHEQVRKGFSVVAAAQPERVRRVGAAADVEAVQQEVRSLLAGVIV